MMPNPNRPETTLDAAIALGRQGYRVFPVIENGKIPAIGAWPQRATTDEAEIRRMWTTHDPVLGTTTTRNYNIGIATQGLLVLDVDNKGDKRGSETLAELDVMNGVPDTFTVETPTGGLHLYYRPAEEVANSAGKVGHGLDVRGQGGYVVAPGSTIDGKAYKVQKAAQLADAPFWLEAEAGKAPRRDPKLRQVIDILDMQPAVDRATRMLLDAPAAVEGAGGDHHTFRVACAVKDVGVSELTALQLMAEHWNPRCAPPWPDEALAVKVANAYRYGKRAIGEGSAQADFGPVEQGSTEIPTEGPKPRPTLYRRRFSEIQPRLGETSLVQKLLGEGGMSVVYGQSNTGKTFFAMALAHAIATGQPFAGLKATQGAVVYVAAEAGVSAENRIAALRSVCKAQDVPFDLVPCPVDLLRADGDTKPLIDLIREAEAEHGKVRLVVIDTLSRAIAGGNENDSADMGALVKHLDAIRAACRTHVMVVHHAGKDQAKGARGHSLLRAATDTEIEIADGVATTTKQRDMEASPPIGFDLKVVELGTGPDGLVVTSCVCVPMQAGSAAEDFGAGAGGPEDLDREVRAIKIRLRGRDRPEKGEDLRALRMALLLRALGEAVEANDGQPVSGEAWLKAAENAISDGIITGKKGFFEAWGNRPREDSRGRLLRTMRTMADDKGLVRKNKRDQYFRG